MTVDKMMKRAFTEARKGGQMKDWKTTFVASPSDAGIDRERCEALRSLCWLLFEFFPDQPRHGRLRLKAGSLAIAV